MSDNGLGSSWIYIVLTIVIAVISGLKKSKKSTESTRIPMSRSEETSEYPSDWGQIVDGQEEYTNPELVEEKQQENVGRCQESLSVDKEPEEEKDDDVKEEFDLKKAIIYSEILNRKY